MEVRYYCDSMYSELTFFKAKIYNIVRAVERMPSENKEKLIPKLNELYYLMDYINEKIDQLMRECPVNWSATKKEIESKKKELVEKINYWDMEHIPGGYVGG